MSTRLGAVNPELIIVLANQMNSHGVLNSESMARAKFASKLFSETSAKYIVTCGWNYRKDSMIKIADAFKSYLVEELGVNSKYIMTELNSRDTVGDALFTKINIVIPSNWKNICVVTSEYHVIRTKKIFQFVYGDGYMIDVRGIVVPFDDATLTNELASTMAFIDTFHGVKMGDHENMLVRLREAHPFYNGNTYEKMPIKELSKP